MKMTVSVGHLDGDTNVLLLPPDFIAWERKSKSKTSDLVNGMGMDDLAYLAWHSQKRNGKTTAAYDTWMEGITSIEPIADEPVRPSSEAN